MSLVLVHMACPFQKLAIANALAGLSGRVDEHSIRLQSLPGKPAAIWDGIKGYPSGRWQGASQSLELSFVQTMLGDAQVKKPESFYVAYDKATLTPLDTNCPAWPANPSFAAFIALLGLEIWVDPQWEPLPST